MKVRLLLAMFLTGLLLAGSAGAQQAPYAPNRKPLVEKLHGCTTLRIVEFPVVRQPKK